MIGEIKLLEVLYTFHAKLNEVTDGDTLELNVDAGFETWRNPIAVRLRGIDTPETFKPESKLEEQLGEMIKEYVKIKLTRCKEIIIRTFRTKTGSNKKTFTRYVADVQYDGIDLVQEMLDKGFEKSVILNRPDAVEYLTEELSKLEGGLQDVKL